MITIDTLKIKTPLHTVSKINNSCNWLETAKGTSNGLTHKSKMINSIGLGFKSILVDELNETLTLEMSSKILGKDYFQLINSNTIEQVVDVINQFDIIQLNKNELISNYTEILKADFCQNLQVANDVNSYFPHLLSARCNNRYTINNWNEAKNKGVEIRRNVKSQKVRQIFYNKLLNLEQDKHFFKNANYNEVKNQFEGILRVECNATSFKTIKELTESKTNKLLDVFQANGKPNLNLFNKSMEKVLDMSLFACYDASMKFSDIEKIEGRKQIIKTLNFDLTLINEFIDKYVGGNNSRYKRDYRDLTNQMLVDAGMITNPNENVFLTEIKYLLSA